MAFLRVRPDGRVEIRETRTTVAGPRARTLAGFRGALSPDVLARARSRARQPFDADALLARARALGLPVARAPREPEARALLARLRRGPLGPVWAGLLREALGDAASAPPPERLADVVEWLGASDAERGEALRGLLRFADRVERSRGALRRRPQRRFPRFASRPREAA